MENHYLVTVIITTYNAENTIKKAVRSVLNTIEYQKIEIVMVDDCSIDTTYQIIEDLSARYKNISIYQMEKNSGGPSAPRNFGISKARGKYITFLDDDDEVIADNLLSMVRKAEEEDVDFAKGYLMVDDRKEKRIANRLVSKGNTIQDTIKALVIEQSTTADSLIRKSFLDDSLVRYRTDIKIGEDSLFTFGLLGKEKKVLYIDEFFYIYNKQVNNIYNLSSTQKVSDKEVRDQVIAWKSSEEILKKIGLSFYKLRLPAGFRNLMLSIVKYSNGISQETYQMLYEFAAETRKEIEGAMNLAKRYQELYDAILSGDYEKYQKESKRRMLINGYDLKFILPLVKYLKKDYVVQIDEWTGHNAHDMKKSKEFAEWADIIWCEWLLGNAVYYTKVKNKNQNLVIRAHRFEITREFGYQVAWDKVDAVFTVSYYWYEKFSKVFQIPREKMRLLSNYVEDKIYQNQKTEDVRYHIGMIGILPKRKGFLRGLEILKRLVSINPKFQFYVMGKTMEEVSWIKNNPEEKEYFDLCEQYIKENQLQEHIIYGGYVERVCLYDSIGYVLSLSDNEVPESFHLALVEGGCSNSIGLMLRWFGAEYIYPQDIIFDSLDDIVEEIRKASEEKDYYNRKAIQFRNYILSNYTIDNFIIEVKNYLTRVRIGG